MHSPMAGRPDARVLTGVVFRRAQKALSLKSCLKLSTTRYNTIPFSGQHLFEWLQWVVTETK